MSDRAMVIELAEKLERKDRFLDRLKKASEEKTKQAGMTLAVVSGGVAMGAARGLWGDGERGEVNFPGSDIDIDGIAAALVTAFGASGLAGKAGDFIMAFGAGGLAFYAGSEAQRALKK